MMRRMAGLAAILTLILLAGYAYGGGTGSFQERVTRHVLASVLQILAPLAAGLGCLAAARAYAPGDRERTVWTMGAAAALAWTVGRVVYAAYQWWGGSVLPSPSAADGFFVAFYLLLALALTIEGRLVLPMVERPVRLGLALLGLAGWAVGVVYFLAPVLSSPASPVQKLLAAFYPTAAVFLVPAGLLPAVGFRGGHSAYAWLAVAVAALCLAAASLGYALLTWYNLYSDVHEVNLLWVAGFVFLAVGGFWQRRVQEDV